MKPTSRILDAGTYRPPTRAVAGDDGEVVYEKLPGILHKLYVSPAGNYVRLPLANANAAAEPTMGQYGHQIMAKKAALGWFPAGQCPISLVAVGQLAANWLPKSMRKETNACAPGSFSHDKPCKHTQFIVDTRKGKQVEWAAKKEIQHKSESDKVLEARDKQHQELLSAIVGQKAGKSG